MQHARNRLGAIALAACLLVALAFGGAAAVAAGGFPDDGTNYLKFSATRSTEADFVADIAEADVVVDAYKLADAAPDANYVKYNYTLVAPFTSLALPSDAAATAESWQKLAEDAAKLVTADMEPLTVAADGASELALPDDGLYLLLPHGKDNAPAYGADVIDSLYAPSASYKYTFAPSITAAPTKEADASGVISTAGDGEWLRHISITLKPEREPLLGSLKITKSLSAFAGNEPATFVFRIVGTTPEGKAYDNYAAITCNPGELSGEVVVTGIPAGTKLAVTEEYTGARYEYASGDTAQKTIVSDEAVENGAEMASAAFANNPNGEGTGGHGVQNNFTLEKTGESDSAWDWVWHSTPEQAAA